MSHREEITERDPLDVLADEFASRCRNGEEPSVEEYVARRPDLADEIRKLLPTVAFLERGKRAGLHPGSTTESGEMAALSGPLVERLGENRVVREIGRGGMGIVYEATQEPLGRRVAVKIMPRHAHSDIKGRKRFYREAKVVAKLQHPHIVPIHAIGEQDGLPYYVMAYIDGAGLDQLLANPGKIIPKDVAARAKWVARLGFQAADALAYAHSQNVLHRDIKPANLLLDSAGQIWLADFGLAKLADDLTLTASGELSGTLRYLAPECLRDRADARSDIYSLGLTLYELLLGQPVFLELDRVRLLHQIEAHQVVPPRRLNSALPRDIETIILKAIAREPSARYATAAALADDLQRFVEGRPIKARRTSVAERVVRWGRRNPVVAGLMGSSMVLGLLFAYYFRLWWMAPPHARPPVRGLDDSPAGVSGEMLPPDWRPGDLPPGLTREMLPPNWQPGDPIPKKGRRHPGPPPPRKSAFEPRNDLGIPPR